MDATFSRWSRDSLVWLPERGMGYFNVAAMPYDAAYFDKYRGYAATDMGRQLTRARIGFVARHYEGPLLDVGIGSGHFVSKRPDTYGFDVNPAGIQWLMDRGLFRDLYGEEVPSATFWDSLEHIADPGRAVNQIAEWAFVSVPIFQDGAHVLRSKHYRRDEHCVYWTADGLAHWFAEQGFALQETSAMECSLGREDIGTYAFRRVRR